MSADLVLMAAGAGSMGLGALAALLPGRLRHGCSAAAGMLGSLLLLIGALMLLLQGQTRLVFWPLGHELLELNLRIDPLAAFFIALVAVVALPVHLYSLGYLQLDEYCGRNTRLIWALTHLFVLSMLGVVAANQAVAFLISWESMALLSFFLVISDTRSRESRRAGFLYLAMTHVGTAALLLMFLLLARISGSLVFSDWVGLGGHLAGGLKSGLFALALLGFGAKAGLIPLHIWLPEAHPAAPGHVSALMSGVMLKTALYGLLRFVFEVLAPFPYAWGMLLMLLCVLTAFLGIVYAAESTDIKRLLAYSSIENIGIILLPVGLAMIFQSAGFTALAQLALVASLFHALNHAIFKGLLFLAAGAVVSQVHTRDLDAMGGLIRSMPRTAALFLVGALSLCAFPPFNGFISKWLIYQSLLASFQLPSTLLKLVAPISAAILGLVGALAAATLVKAFSTAFLALPRSHHARHGQEAPLSMQAGMALLAGLCLLLGVLPQAPLRLISGLSRHLLPAPLSGSALGLDSLQISLEQPLQATASPAGLLLLLLILIPLGLVLPRLLGRPSPLRREITWSCGVTPESRFEHNASGFQQPLELVFGQIQQTAPGYLEHVYRPLARGLDRLSARMSRLQSGNLHLYLAYVFVTLVLTLIWVLL
ncbi:MAG: proton-conducting transporter membrane subunit [Candidatus Sericytochromatia bacterium]